MADDKIKVFPSSKLGPNEYVKGVGAGGTELPKKEAEALLAAGLVQKSKTAESEDKK